eukprot:7097846-Prymnesium_polylepis.1
MLSVATVEPSERVTSDARITASFAPPRRSLSYSTSRCGGASRLHSVSRRAWSDVSVRGCGLSSRSVLGPVAHAASASIVSSTQRSTSSACSRSDGSRGDRKKVTTRGGTAHPSPVSRTPRAAPAASAGKVPLLARSCSMCVEPTGTAVPATGGV